MDTLVLYFQYPKQCVGLQGCLFIKTGRRVRPCSFSSDQSQTMRPQQTGWGAGECGPGPHAAWPQGGEQPPLCDPFLFPSQTPGISSVGPTQPHKWAMALPGKQTCPAPRLCFLPSPVSLNLPDGPASFLTEDVHREALSLCSRFSEGLRLLPAPAPAWAQSPLPSTGSFPLPTGLHPSVYKYKASSCFKKKQNKNHFASSEAFPATTPSLRSPL